MFGIPLWALQIGAGLALAGAVAFGIHHWEATIREKELAAFQAQAAAKEAVIDKKLADVTAASSDAEAAAQAANKEKTNVIVRTIPQIVEKAIPVACVPWSLVRLHDAAARGDDTGAHPAPAGQPDEACSTITPTQFAVTVAQNYGIARANAEQLDALEADVQKRLAVASGAK